MYDCKCFSPRTPILALGLEEKVWVLKLGQYEEAPFADFAFYKIIEWDILTQLLPQGARYKFEQTSSYYPILLVRDKIYLCYYIIPNYT